MHGGITIKKNTKRRLSLIAWLRKMAGSGVMWIRQEAGSVFGRLFRKFCFQAVSCLVIYCIKNSNFATSWIEKSCFDSLQEQEIFVLPKTSIQILGSKRPSREWVPEPLLRRAKLASHFYIQLRLRMTGTILPCPFTHLCFAQWRLATSTFHSIEQASFRMWSTQNIEGWVISVKNLSLVLCEIRSRHYSWTDWSWIRKRYVP
jgi:hypothetical protein